jgi:hypothetical protein
MKTCGCQQWSVEELRLVAATSCPHDKRSELVIRRIEPGDMPFLGSGPDVCEWREPCFDRPGPAVFTMDNPVWTDGLRMCGPCVMSMVSDYIEGWDRKGVRKNGVQGTGL